MVTVQLEQCSRSYLDQIQLLILIKQKASSLAGIEPLAFHYAVFIASPRCVSCSTVLRLSPHGESL